MRLEDMTQEEIIKKLLGAADAVPERTVLLKRLGIPVKIRALSDKQVDRIQEQCTVIRRKRGEEIRRINDEEFNAAVIVAATVAPNWADPQLLDKFKASSAEEAVKRILLAGEVRQLVDAILDLSGYYTDLDDVKN
ncbi:MAG: hypothetical protein AB1402_02985 [Bacillota bacterium]